MSATEFITLHDTYAATKRRPNGRPFRVRTSSIDSIKGYDDGLVRSIVAVHGLFHHVAETADQIEAAIHASTETEGAS